MNGQASPSTPATPQPTTPEPATPPSPVRRRRSRRRTWLVGILAVAVVLAGGSFAWTTLTSGPAGDPAAVEFADARLSVRLTSATVLALGEATHGTAEFQTARLQLIQKVAAQGFTTIALEDPAGSSSQVDAWLQGGPGTAEQAAQEFGFRLYRTREMAELLTWVRAFNEAQPAEKRVRLYGLDMQRPDADKAVVLGWLAGKDPAAAARFTDQLASVNDDAAFDAGVNAAALDATRELAALVERLGAGSTDDATLRARLSARALVQGRENGAGAWGAARDAQLADQLAFLVDARAAAGGRHTLLFAHNGHVDRAGQATAVPGATMGVLNAQRWGDAYRAIGTDGNRVSLNSRGTIATVTVNSPIRGLFAGTRVGFVEVAEASGASEVNAEVLRRTMPMVSVGEPFDAWQAWIPPLHQVQVRPVDAWDALIYVADARPTTGL